MSAGNGLKAINNLNYYTAFRIVVVEIVENDEFNNSEYAFTWIFYGEIYNNFHRKDQSQDSTLGIDLKISIKTKHQPIKYLFS